MAADLEQPIDPADEFQEAVGPTQAHVAGREGAAVRIGRIRGEGGCGQLGLAPVAQSQMPAGDHHLAGLPVRGGGAVLAQDAQLQAGGEPAHRQAGAALQRLVHEPAHEAGRTLGGGDRDLQPRIGPEGAPEQVDVVPVAAVADQPHDPDRLQGLAVGRRRGEPAEQGRHHLDHGGAANPDLFHQPIGPKLPRRQDVQRRAVHQRPEAVAQGSHGRGVEDAAAVDGGDLADLSRDRDVVQHIGVAVEHALRPSGRAGGVENIGRVIGAGSPTRLASRNHGVLDLEDRQCRREQRSRLSCELARGEDAADPGVVGDGPDARARMLGIEHQRDASGLQRAQQREMEARIERNEDRHRTLLRIEGRLRRTRNAGDLAGQFRVGQTAVQVLDRQAVGGAARDGGEPAADGVFGVWVQSAIVAGQRGVRVRPTQFLKDGVFPHLSRRRLASWTVARVRKQA